VSILIVVDNPRDWPLDLPGVGLVAARAYLTDPAYGEGRSVKVFNLCKSYRYQSLGYYVSLLAEARGQPPGQHDDLPELGRHPSWPPKTSIASASMASFTASSLVWLADHPKALIRSGTIRESGTSPGQPRSPPV